MCTYGLHNHWIRQMDTNVNTDYWLSEPEIRLGQGVILMYYNHLGLQTDCLVL